MPATARGRGRGTVYLRSDGIWVARVDVGTKPRKRLTFSSKSRAIAEAKLDAWLEVNRPGRATPRVPTNREQYMRDARAIERHTAAQWRDKVARSRGLCFYCSRHVRLGGVKDHVIPVSRGGSDGIGNVVLACWDCNAAKSDMNEAEFRVWADLSEFFTKPQQVTVSAKPANRRVPPDVAALMRVPRKDRAGWTSKTPEERARLLKRFSKVAPGGRSAAARSARGRTATG